MKHWIPALAIAALLLTLLVYFFASRLDPGRPAVAGGDDPPAEDDGVEEVRASFDELASRVTALPSQPVPPPADSTGSPASEPADSASPFAKRFEAIESELKDLKKTLENLVPASEVTSDEFATPDGYTHADAYFEQRKYATAASGYLTFLENHPHHPDALELLKKARDAYGKAGYPATAIDLQKQILEEYPNENRYRETLTLAHLEKEAKRYDDAILHVEQALESSTHPEEKLWGLNWRAWYVELGRGPEAGLAAYQEAEQVARSLGLGDSRPAKKTRERITRLEKLIAAMAQQR